MVNVSRKELSLRSLNSLLYSMDYHRLRGAGRMRLVLIDDHSSDDMRKEMLGLCELRGHPAQIVDVVGHGNGDSLNTHYEWAKDNSEDLIFFLEDDYVHEPQMLEEMVNFFGECEKRPGMDQVVLHPCDYPDRYHRELYKSWILLGESRHWRSVYHTTSTTLIKKQTLTDYWTNYMGLTKYGKEPGVTEDNTINKIYHHVPCFSPMPSLSVHVQYTETVSPFKRWEQMWHNARYETTDSVPSR